MKVFMPGRFQPFHLGHLSAIRKALDRYDLVYLGLGTGRSDRPLNFAQRRRLIEKALDAEGLLGRVRIVDVPDVGDDCEWVKGVLRRCPGVTAVISGNPWVRRCFRGVLPVSGPEWCNKSIYNGTAIRNLIKKGGDWRGRVPDAIAKDVEKLLGGEGIGNRRRARSGS